MKKNNGIRITIVAGFALFSLIFGAGNLIFPPALGLSSGNEWLSGFIGFFLVDVGLAILCIFTMLKYDGLPEQFSGRIGKKISPVYLFILVSCTGPLIGISRTGSVSFSMSIKPFLGEEMNNPWLLFLYSLIFFAVVFVFSIKPGKVIDIIGQYLTPVLLACIIGVIVIGIVTAEASPTDKIIDSPVGYGISNGYQTMDPIGLIVFSSLLIASASKSFNNDKKAINNSLIKSAIIAGVLLLVVYCGLTYLGSVWGQPFSDIFVEGKITQAGLLDMIIYSIIGKNGLIVLSIVSLLACLTTAIGLTTAFAQFYVKFFKDRISYKVMVLIICGISLLFCNVGLSQILAIANPILDIIYPSTIVLIILGLFHKLISSRIPFVAGFFTALACSILRALYVYVGLDSFAFINELPFSQFSLGFVLPTAIAIVISLIFVMVTKKKSDKLFSK